MSFNRTLVSVGRMVITLAGVDLGVIIIEVGGLSFDKKLMLVEFLKFFI